MAKSEGSPALAALFDLARYLFLSPVVVQVQDIIKALDLKNKIGEKPIVCHHHKIKTGWHVVISMPEGLCSDHIINGLQYFEESLGACYIEPKVNGSKVHLDIHMEPLPEGKKLPYNFDPADYPDMFVPVPIGMSYEGMQVVDLSTLPHLFIAGSTGSGKTVEEKDIAQACLQLSGPREVQISEKKKVTFPGVELTVIDLKRLDYFYLEKYAQLAETFGEALNILVAAKVEMRERIAKLRAAYCFNWHEYVTKGHQDMPYKVILIDELGELNDDETETEKKANARTKKAQRTLESLVKLCRAAGISFVCATQRPSAKLWKGGDFREVISLFDAKLGFRTVDSYNSEIILGRGNETAYTAIGLEEKGRAIWHCGGETLVQSMYLKNPRNAIKDLPQRKVEKSEPKKPKGSPSDRFQP